MTRVHIARGFPSRYIDQRWASLSSVVRRCGFWTRWKSSRVAQATPIHLSSPTVSFGSSWDHFACWIARVCGAKDWLALKKRTGKLIWDAQISVCRRGKNLCLILNCSLKVLNLFDNTLFFIGELVNVLYFFILLLCHHTNVPQKDTFNADLGSVTRFSYWRHQSYNIKIMNLRNVM